MGLGDQARWVPGVGSEDRCRRDSPFFSPQDIPVQEDSLHCRGVGRFASGNRCGRELVGFDDNGRPEFNRLQSLVTIRDKRIRVSDYIEARADEVLAAVREQHLEGIVGKRRDSIYEPGRRSGVWIRHRVNLGREFVIGGYFPGPHGIDSLIVGYYEENQLMYVARTRNGFVPASRRQVFSKPRHLVTPTCPFVNLPETRTPRWGEALSAEKMKKAIWLRPEAVAQIEFLEWTGADRLRHSRFVGLRDDKVALSGTKEHNGES